MESPPDESECDGTIKPDDGVREIHNIPDHPTTPKVLRDVPVQTTSVPINIEAKNTDRNMHPLPMASFDAKSIISEPIVAQSAFLERNSQVGNWLPASPPGRAVPVVQIQVIEPRATSEDSVQDGMDRGNANQSERQAVRTQPSDNVVHGRPMSEEEKTGWFREMLFNY